MTQTILNKGHVALYRKYRPAVFDNLVGQDHIRATLENAIKHNKVVHAYLFTGPRGTGKTTTAKLFAKALNCKQPDGINPCGKCDSCRDGNLDIVEMDAASNNGVDDMRDLQSATQTAPLNSKYKIFIIDECHMITNQGFNALLKTLEEPPAHVIFILATTEAHKVPPTILSRCQRYDFRRIPQHKIIERLSHVAKEENISIEPQAVQVIAQVAAGGLRDALGYLDQASSLAEGAVTLDAVLELTGAVDIRKIGELLIHIARKETEKAIAYFNTCYEQGNEPKYFVDEMQVYLRDVLVYSKIGDVAAVKKAGTDTNFPTVVQELGNIDVYGFLNRLQETAVQLKTHHDAQLLIEMTIIQMTTGDLDLQGKVLELENKLNSLLAGGTIQIAPQEVPQAPINQPVNEPVEEPVKSQPNEPIEVQEDEMQATNVDLSLLEGISSNSMDIEPSQEQQSEKAPGTTVVKEVIEEPPFTSDDEVLDVTENVGAFIKHAEENPSNWEDQAHLYTSVPPEENDYPVVEPEPTDEVIVTSEEGTQEETENENKPKLNTNVILDDKELEVMNVLKTAVKEHREQFTAIEPTFEEELKSKKSTFNLFKEFKVKAVNDEAVIVVHEEKVKVKLLEKVKNLSTIEAAIEAVYKPLRLVVISMEQWATCVELYRAQNNK